MMTISILEDEDSIREVLEVFLMMEGYEVNTSRTISEFLTSYKDQNTDLFLLDVRLPDGSEIDICKKIKDSSNNENIPVVLMSANTDIREIENDLGHQTFIILFRLMFMMIKVDNVSGDQAGSPEVDQRYMHLKKEISKN